MLPAQFGSPSRHPRIRLLTYDTSEIPVPANLSLGCVHKSAPGPDKPDYVSEGMSRTRLQIVVLPISREYWITCPPDQ